MNRMNMYLINNDTMAILPDNRRLSKIYENKKEMWINKKPTTIINNNCMIKGSSLEGRIRSTEYATGINYKPPISIDDKENIIFFPTASPRLKNCGWINLKFVKHIKKNGKNTEIEFFNRKKLIIESSFNIINNQILKASRLEYVLRQNTAKN